MLLRQKKQLVDSINENNNNRGFMNFLGKGGAKKNFLFAVMYPKGGGCQYSGGKAGVFNKKCICSL